MFNPNYAVYAALVALVLAFAFALRKGDRAERIGGGLNLAAGIFAVGVESLAHAGFLDADIQPLALLMADAFLAAGFLFLAVRYASLWLGVAMLLQAVQFSLHAYYMVSDLPHDMNYARVNNFDTAGIFFCIIGGTIVSWRRRSRAERAEAAKVAGASSASV